MRQYSSNGELQIGEKLKIKIFCALSLFVIVCLFNMKSYQRLNPCKFMAYLHGGNIFMSFSEKDTHRHKKITQRDYLCYRVEHIS